MSKQKAPPAAPELPPDDDQEIQLLMLMLTDGYDGPRLMSSIDLSTRAGKRFFLNAKSPPSFQPDALRGKVFRLVNWIGELRKFHDDETGEDRDAVSVTMIDPDGRTARFGSEAVTRALDVIRTLYGNGPYEPPLFIRVEPYRTKNSRNSYTLQEVDPESVTKEQQTW